MTAVHVSSTKYKNYDCDEIEVDALRTSQRLMDLYKHLKVEAENDTFQTGVGVLLFWPALFMLEGGDGPEAVEYRSLKGDYVALQEASLTKKCDIEFVDFDAKIQELQAAEKRDHRPSRNRRR